VPHPATPCAAVKAIAVSAVRSSSGRLAFTYTIEGDMSRIRVPPPAPRRRGDGLWRHTCFEAFVAAGAGPEYFELNFSPSGEWACYAFTGYREGMAAVQDAVVRIDQTSVPAHWALRADTQIASLRASEPLRLALSAVIEETDGRVSYWALRHPEGKPDFHHASGFALRL
jgi:hypothetical protein